MRAAEEPALSEASLEGADVACVEAALVRVEDERVLLVSLEVVEALVVLKEAVLKVVLRIIVEPVPDALAAGVVMLMLELLKALVVLVSAVLVEFAPVPPVILKRPE